MSGDDSEGGDAGPAASVRSDGGTVLVVGEEPAGVHQTAYRNLLGPADEDTRQLVVLSGRDTAGVDRYLPAGTLRDPEHLRVIEHDVSTRSAAADGGRSGPAGLDDAVLTEVDGDDLAGLGATISERVDAFDAVAGGLAAGDLRVCLDSLGAVVERHGETDVFGFVHLLTGRLGRADAAGFFHLPVAPGGRTAGMFASLFDHVVAVRIRDGSVATRWDGGDWEPLEE